MSNIAGKAYAMNVVTPIRWYTTWVNKLYFWVAGSPLMTSVLGWFKVDVLKGLKTLSLIHYARWVIIGRRQFPHLSPDQPKEHLKYSYMLFFSNFNGSWDQYVDSFTFAIPSGLDLFWKWNVRYSKSVPLTPFHRYIRYNQLETLHYYNAYPLAAANDVKSAHTVRDSLAQFTSQLEQGDDAAFLQRYNALLRGLQHDLGDMHPTPIVTMSAYQVERRTRWHAAQRAPHNTLQQGE